VPISEFALLLSGCDVLGAQIGLQPHRASAKTFRQPSPLGWFRACCPPFNCVCIQRCLPPIDALGFKSEFAGNLYSVASGLRRWRTCRIFPMNPWVVHARFRIRRGGPKLRGTRLASTPPPQTDARNGTTPTKPVIRTRKGMESSWIRTSDRCASRWCLD